MAHTFVTEFPAEQALTLGQAILNKQFSLDLWRPAWVVLEYGLGVYLPGNPAPNPMKRVDLANLPEDAFTDDDLELVGHMLQSAAHGEYRVVSASFANDVDALPWGTIIPILIQLIASLLKK